MNTQLASAIKRHGQTYTSVARRSGLQARTIRQIATGETPIDRVSIGTIRRIAAALEVPVSALVEPGQSHPGDPAVSRSERLARAIRDVMWAGGVAPVPYPSPVESIDDSLAHVEPADFFAGTEVIGAGRG